MIEVNKNIKLILASLVFIIFSSVSSEIINCSPQDFEIDFNGNAVNINNAIAIFQYNRDSLEAYEYLGTPAVNLFLGNASVFVLGNSKNQPYLNIENGISFSVNVLAIANTFEISEDKKGLKDCLFGIYDKEKKSPNVHENSQSVSDDFKAEVFRKMDECLEFALCESLNAIEKADFSRGKKNHPSFGPLDVYSKSLHHHIDNDDYVYKPPSVEKKIVPRKLND